jgi:hypothetical protein
MVNKMIGNIPKTVLQLSTIISIVILSNQGIRIGQVVIGTKCTVF